MEGDIPVSLKFESAPNTATTELDKVKIVTLEDKTGNKYTLDINTDNLKLKYHKHGNPNATEYTVTGLATALGSLLSTKDNDKSVLVGTLREFLGSSDKAEYDGQSKQTAKEFLGDKGLKGEKGDTGKDGIDGVQGPQGEKGDTGKDGIDGTSPSAADQALQKHVATISIRSPEFKEAVQEEMSQLSFDIPPSDDAALNWTW